MDLSIIVNNSPIETVREALVYFLVQYTNPAFGTLPKSEVELIVLNVLETLGAIDGEPEVYELISKLKITRSKARNLIYSRELRRSTEENLDKKVRALLKRPSIQKNGDLFTLEVENPLVSDHLRSKIRKLGYVSDGSFSPNVIKLGIEAISAIIEAYLTDDERKQVREALVQAGAPDTSLRGILKATLKKVASKVASETGEALMDKTSEYFGPIMDAGIDQITERVGKLFGGIEQGG